MTVQDGNLPTETGPQDPFPHGQVTLDNLIHAGEIPTTIAVFLTPGSLDPDFTSSQPGDVNQRGGSDDAGDTNPDRRSLEYDTVDGTYASFLERDILSVVEAEFRITKEPAHRMVTGGSSGAICAFSCAWFRPDLFGKVLCWVGASSPLSQDWTHRRPLSPSSSSLSLLFFCQCSCWSVLCAGAWVNIRGGHHYPWMVRNTLRKPIVVYLAEGENDSNSQVSPTAPSAAPAFASRLPLCATCSAFS